MVFVFCFVSFDQSFGQDSLAFLLLHAASAEVTYWCALGRWAGLESPFGSVHISGVLAGLAGELNSSRTADRHSHTWPLFHGSLRVVGLLTGSFLFLFFALS